MDPSCMSLSDCLKCSLLWILAVYPYQKCSLLWILTVCPYQKCSLLWILAARIMYIPISHLRSISYHGAYLYCCMPISIHLRSVSYHGAYLYCCMPISIHLRSVDIKTFQKCRLPWMLPEYLYQPSQKCILPWSLPVSLYVHIKTSQKCILPWSLPVSLYVHIKTSEKCILPWSLLYRYMSISRHLRSVSFHGAYLYHYMSISRYLRSVSFHGAYLYRYMSISRYLRSVSFHGAYLYHYMSISRHLRSVDCHEVLTNNVLVSPTSLSEVYPVLGPSCMFSVCPCGWQWGGSAVEVYQGPPLRSNTYPNTVVWTAATKGSNVINFYKSDRSSIGLSVLNINDSLTNIGCLDQINVSVSLFWRLSQTRMCVK